jgi:hypothetical protein
MNQKNNYVNTHVILPPMCVSNTVLPYDRFHFLSPCFDSSLIASFVVGKAADGNPFRNEGFYIFSPSFLAPSY